MAVSKSSGGLAAYAVAKAKKDGSHTASLSTAAIEKQIANVVSGLPAAWGCGCGTECSAAPSSSTPATTHSSSPSCALSCAGPLFDVQGGELELTLLLGDPSAPKGVSGVLGTIELPEGASGAAPKPKLLTARHQPISSVKPKIAHTFVSVGQQRHQHIV